MDLSDLAVAPDCPALLGFRSRALILPMAAMLLCWNR